MSPNKLFMDINKKEEEILKILWDREAAFVKEIITDLDEDPKPPYNTISSLVRRMVDKGLLKYHSFGKTHQYYPVVTKEEVKNIKVTSLLKDYFDNSFSDMLSYFVAEGSADTKEIEQLLKQIKKQK